jgi:hypothetical protein
MSWVTSGADEGDGHALLSDPVRGVGRECEADTASLVCRVDGDHVDLAEGLRVAEREGGEADDGTVELSDPHVHCIVSADVEDGTALSVAPIRVELLEDTGAM